MGFLARLLGEPIDRQPASLGQGAEDFLAGRKDTLTSVDVDPEGAATFARYELAMVLKKKGNLSAAAELLYQSCSPPSIYKGHYRELFKISRQLNRNDLKTGNYCAVLERVRLMARLDNEMIHEMLRYWSIQQNRQLPHEYFDNDRNLLVTDAKALLRAAQEFNDVQSAIFAESLLTRFAKPKNA